MGWLLQLVLDLAVGGFAGFVAGKIMHSEGGLVRNVIVGVVGGLVGGLIFSVIGFGVTNIIGSIIVSIVGACLCLFLVDKFFKK